MTNAEKFKNEVLLLCDDRDREGFNGFAVQNGKPCFCEDVVDCGECDLNSMEETNCTCDFIRWLYKEYTEPKPTLTPAERAFCETITENGWIARDGDGVLYVHSAKPKINDYLEWHNEYDSWIEINKNMFMFIKNDRPWSIKKLLELEVQP